MNKRYPLILCGCLGLLGPAARAQGPQPAPPVVSGDFRGLPFEQFAQRVEAQTPYRFFFNPAATDTVVVRLQADRLPLVAALTQVLGRARLHFALDEAHPARVRDGRPAAANAAAGRRCPRAARPGARRRRPGRAGGPAAAPPRRARRSLSSTR